VVNIARNIILEPKHEDEMNTIELVLPLKFKEIFDNNLTFIDNKLLFWEHHFDAFVNGYPNGYKKTGTIRHKPGHIRLPFGNRLPVYATKEYERGEDPRGIATIDYVVACQLNELTEDEWLHDGFKNQEEIFESMKSYYPGIKPDSLISYYHFKEYDSNPSRLEIKRLLKVVNR
jgi:hypothetical protein